MKKLTPEQLALREFEKVGDDKLFPNHTDKDIWVSGFRAGFIYSNRYLTKAEIFRLPDFSMVTMVSQQTVEGVNKKGDTNHCMIRLIKKIGNSYELWVAYCESEKPVKYLKELVPGTVPFYGSFMECNFMRKGWIEVECDDVTYWKIKPFTGF